MTSINRHTRHGSARFRIARIGLSIAVTVFVLAGRRRLKLEVIALGVRRSEAER